MPLKVQFAPYDILDEMYNASMIFFGQEPRDRYFGFRFERMLEQELSAKTDSLFPGKSVKLIGLTYEQFNDNGYSYFPLQLIVAGKYQRIQWVKWKCEGDNYFMINIKKDERLDKVLPTYFDLCSSEENARLTELQPLPKLEYNVCDPKFIKLLPSANLHAYDKRLDFNENIVYVYFMYEFRRQVTELLTNITGLKSVSKYLSIGSLGFMNAENFGEYTYSRFELLSKPIWQLDSGIDIEIRWRSRTDKQFISLSDIVSQGDVEFEFTREIPEGRFSYIKEERLRKFALSKAKIASKELLFSFINSNEHKPNQLSNV